MLTDINLKGTNEKGWDNAQQDQPPESPERPRTTSLWVAFAFLVVALLGALGYGYYILRENNVQISQLPAAIKSVVALNGRVNATEARLVAWTAELQDVVGRMGKLEQKTARNLNAANKHAERLTTELEGRLQEKLDGQAYVDNTRLNQLESKQKSEHAQLAQIEEKLGSARRELAAVQQDITALRQDTGQRLASLDSQVIGNSRSIDAVSRRLDHRRVDFEVVKDHTYELAQGISLKLTGTNVAYQRFGGMVSVVPEGRTLWVDQQGIQQPVVFYRKQDGERCELIVTRVAGKSATGYLLLSADQSAPESGEASELTLLPGVGR